MKNKTKNLENLIEKSFDIAYAYEYVGLGFYGPQGDPEMLGSILSGISKIIGYQEMKYRFINKGLKDNTADLKRFNLSLCEGKGLKFNDDRSAKEYLENLILYKKMEYEKMLNEQRIKNLKIRD